MDDKKIEKIVDFIEYSEGLKRLLRNSWLSNERQESVAEHTWRVALIASLIAPETDLKFDLGKILQMITIHDLVEIEAGDVPSINQVGLAIKLKSESEQKAIEKIRKMLPVESGEKVYLLWQEFEKQKTNEARLAKISDKIEAVVQKYQHTTSRWISFDENNRYGAKGYMEKLSRACSIDPFLLSVFGEVNKRNDLNLALKESVGRLPKKILLLDIDGVLVLRDRYFSDKYAQENNIPIEKVTAFFKGPFKEALTGNADLRDILPSYLVQWEWKGTTDEFLRLWFESECNVDNRVLGLIDEIRQKGTKVYLVSDNEARRAEYLTDEVGLGSHVDGAYFSSSLGVSKSDKEFFTKVLAEIQAEPEDVSYWDDDPKNIEVAKQVGINGHVYRNFEEFYRETIV